MSSISYTLIRYFCQFCRKWREGIVPRVNQDELGTVAFHHGDHVVIVDYDFRGVIRSVNAIRIASEIEGKELKCNRCDRTIYVPLNVPRFLELAYVHGDHVAILYVFNENYFMIDVVDLYNENEIRLLGNTIKKIVSNISVRKFAEVLVRALILKECEIIVPREVIDLVRYVIMRLGELNLFILRSGESGAEKVDLRLHYLERVITGLLRSL